MKFSVAIPLLNLCATEAWVSHNYHQTPKFTSPIRQASQSRLYSESSVSPSGDSNDSNVIFRPSTDPLAFDSYKIGSPRIHRYLRDGGAGDEFEYVMWYHGRSLDQQREESPDVNDEKKDAPLAPLSTGRVGRATSLNGLHWTRTLEGAISEDMKGVTLGLNNESWWGFDTSHVGLGQVLLPLSTPAISSEGGVYLMYYMGGSHDETLLSEFLPGGGIQKDDDTKVKGMKMKIGVALSQDGKSWGRVEGNHHTGACITPFDLAEENGENESSNTNMKEELYCAWPYVVVNESTAQFLLYYSTMEKVGLQKCLSWAVSTDGFAWEKRGVCLRPSSEPDSLDVKGCARCSIVPNAAYDPKDKIWRDVPGFTMYYEGVGEDNKHRILKATSKDGKDWEKQGLVFNVGDGDSWDCGGVGSPHLIRLDDGITRMYYVGQSADGSTAMGVCVAKHNTNDLQEFVREQAQFSFA